MVVMVVSLDGVAPRYVSPERMPNLCGLVRAGSGCFTARTVDPPITRPAHASMLRGVSPGVHGARDNAATPLLGDAPSILAVAHQAGLMTASAVNWYPLDSLIEPRASTHRIFIDAGYDPADDDTIVDLATTLLRSTTPDLWFVYLCAPDLAGHAHGWGSADYLDSLGRADTALGRLIAAAGPRAQFVVTTDHGGSGQDHAGADPDVTETFVAVRSPRVVAGSLWPDASILDIAPTVAELCGIEADPLWEGTSLLGSEEPVLDHFLNALAESDRHSYGEDLSMLEHALQTAAAAEDEGADDELIVAALLHDVGHLRGDAGTHGYWDHAESGARWLGPWFPAPVTEPIRLHVAAKRHMVASDPSYRDRLSDASRVTLTQQGGPFSAAASAAFAAEPHAERAIRLRGLDDGAKVAGLDVPRLDAHRERLARTLATGPVDPAWARDACRCPSCRDERSGQHLIDVDELGGWTVVATRRTDRHLRVELRRGADTHLAVIPVPVDQHDGSTPELWDASFDLRARRRAATDSATMARDLITHGVALADGVSTAPGSVLAFAESLGHVRETNYGRLFDVKADPAPVNLAYSPAPLPLHTDNPYRDPAPTVQVLHCLVPAASGGRTRLSDGFRAAAALRNQSPTAFAALSTTPVAFRFVGDGVHLDARRPVIELDVEGSIRSVAINHRSMATPATESFATALATFAGILEAGAVELLLEAGEALVFDNRRVLHARTGFDPAAGRHLQGCYIDIDAVRSLERVTAVAD